MTNPYYDRPPTEGDLCPQHNRVHNSHGWYVCDPVGGYWETARPGGEVRYVTTVGEVSYPVPAIEPMGPPRVEAGYQAGYQAGYIDADNGNEARLPVEPVEPVEPVDCRTPEGVAVGLIDGILAMARTLRSVERSRAVEDALDDLRQDEDVRALLAAAPPAAPPPPPDPPGTCHLHLCPGKGVHEPHGIGTPTPASFAAQRACPGPHRPVQHRDFKPPWCRVCGCGVDGTNWREAPSTLSGGVTGARDRKTDLAVSAVLAAFPADAWRRVTLREVVTAALWLDVR
jgi:hypothetical protein